MLLVNTWYLLFIETACWNVSFSVTYYYVFTVHIVAYPIYFHWMFTPCIADLV